MPSRSTWSMVLQPPDVVKPGETVRVRFVAGHPQNALQDTYLTVDQYNPTNVTWRTILNDNDWETEFEWYRICFDT